MYFNQLGLRASMSATFIIALRDVCYVPTEVHEHSTGKMIPEAKHGGETADAIVQKYNIISLFCMTRKHRK